MKRIALSKEFGNNIFTRNTISIFFEELKKMKEKDIVLDFKGIDFISRSCADEYIKRKEVCEKKIIEENMSEKVCLMFMAVENQYKRAGIKISFDNLTNRCSMINT